MASVQKTRRKRDSPAPASLTDRANLTVSAVDVDTDSDNNDGFDPPGGTKVEGDLEQDASAPGKYVGINNDDSDRDGVADLGDGFNLSGGNTTSTAGERFTPVHIGLNKPFDITRSTVRFTYRGDDPLDPASNGTMRLWKGGEAQRRGMWANNAATPGDYVGPGDYTAGQLGFAAADREVRFWLEGVAATTPMMMDDGGRTIYLYVDPDGPTGPEPFALYDDTRVTVVDRTPTGLMAMPSSPGTVVLDWADGKPDLTRGYKVYRSDVAGFVPSDATLVTTLNGPAGGLPPSTFTHTGVAGGTWYYKVVALDPAGTPSVHSAQAGVTVAAPANRPPVADDATFAVPENSANGTLVGTVAASDPDAGQTLTYAITAGNDDGALAIHPTTGQVTVADGTKLDHETAASRVLTITATDNGSPALSDAAAVTVNVTDVAEAPAAPADLTATAGAGTVTLNWSAAAGATGYRVYRGTTPGGQSAAPIASDLTSTTYTDTTAAPGQAHYYTVRAFNAGGESAPGTEASATPAAPPPPTDGASPPAAPSNLSGEGVAGEQINLVWSGTTSPEVTGVTIERSGGSATPPGRYDLIGHVAPGVTSYQDAGLEQGVVYQYRLRAYNRDGYSPYSTSVEVFTPLPAPTNLRVTFNNVYRNDPAGAKVQGTNVAWDDNAEGEAGQIIQRRLADGTWVDADRVPPNGREWTLWQAAVQEPQAIRVVAWSPSTSTGFVPQVSSNIVTILPMAPPSGPDAVHVGLGFDLLSWSMISENDADGTTIPLLNGSNTQPVAVELNPPAGAAVEGVDFQPLARRVTLQPGGNGLAFLPIDDTAADENESTRICIRAAEGYYSTAYAFEMVVVNDDPYVDIVDWETYKPETEPEGWTPNRALDEPADAAIPTSREDANLGVVQRIFPEKTSPSDPFHAERRKVSISARVINPAEGGKVYFRVYDADDPSADAPSPVDPNTNPEGQEKGLDNRPNAEEPAILEGTVRADGFATVTFSVSPQPGNNYRVFASMDRRALETLTGLQLDGRVGRPAGVTASPLLTVWRTLHVERDSMKAPAEGDGPFDAGNDDVSVDPEIRPEDLKRMIAGYRPAYIVVADDLEELEQKDDATFLHNATTDDAAVLANGVRDFSSSDDFWVVQTFAAYEPERDQDGDLDVLDTTPPTLGFSPTRLEGREIEDGPSITFVEVVRDVSSPGDTREGGDSVAAALRKQLIVYHETVHRFQIVHDIPPRDPPGPGDQGPLRRDLGQLDDEGKYNPALDDLTAAQLDLIRRESRPGRNDDA